MSFFFSKRKLNSLFLRNGSSLVLLLFFFVVSSSGNLVAQTVSGTVTDASGETLIGASVVIKGTQTGTVTDVDGTFTLNGAKIGDLLQISYTGYAQQELPATSDMLIVLQSGSTLDEVVVTGVFDTRTKMESSIAITTLSSEQLDRVAATSAADLLKNIPGVFVNQARGEIWNSVYSRGLSANSIDNLNGCLLYTSPSPRNRTRSRMPSSA